MSFAALPHELQLRILLHALQPPYGHARQAPTFALVSKQCYAIIRKLIWAHLRIVKPSQLRRIHAALRADPALGSLVHSIHLGPEEELRAQGWPYYTRWEGDGASMHLLTTLPEALLPRWVRPGSSFDADHEDEGGNGCEYSAVHLAIEEAFEQLDVEARKRGWTHWSRPQRRIGIRAWASRLWQVQAALDLYLAEMRRCEDAGSYPITPWQAGEHLPWTRKVDKECRFGTCGHYPRLEVRSEQGKTVESSAEPEAASASLKPFSLSQEQLWTHISKHNDHFDHLLLFLRSDRDELGLDKSGWHLLKRNLGGPHWGCFQDGQSDKEADNELDLPSDEEDDASRAVASRLDFKMDTAENLLDMARNILGLTRQLRNHSLTGFLFRALDGLQTARSLSQLSIGPFARWWGHVLPATDPSSTSRVKAEGEGGIMTRLARLRICGMLSDLDALKIATRLPSLEMMTWEMTDRGYVDAIVQAVQCLQGQLSQPVVPSKRQRHKRYTEVRLRRSNVRKVLAAAPSTEVSDAWRYGWQVEEAPHTVKVVPSGSERKEESDDEVAKTTAAQYEEGRRWWEAGRVGLGLHSEAGEEG